MNVEFVFRDNTGEWFRMYPTDTRVNDRCVRIDKFDQGAGQWFCERWEVSMDEVQFISLTRQHDPCLIHTINTAIAAKNVENEALWKKNREANDRAKCPSGLGAKLDEMVIKTPTTEPEADKPWVSGIFG